jgi:hypothetical protein
MRGNCELTVEDRSGSKKAGRRRRDALLKMMEMLVMKQYWRLNEVAASVKVVADEYCTQCGYTST